MHQPDHTLRAPCLVGLNQIALKVPEGRLRHSCGCTLGHTLSFGSAVAQAKLYDTLIVGFLQSRGFPHGRVVLPDKSLQSVGVVLGRLVFLPLCFSPLKGNKRVELDAKYRDISNKNQPQRDTDITWKTPLLCEGKILRTDNGFGKYLLWVILKAYKQSW